MAATQYWDPSGLLIIEADSGLKINYKIDGTKISFNNEQMTIDLAKFEKEYTLQLPISQDFDNCVTTGTSKKMWAMITIPTKQYILTPVDDPNATIPLYTKTAIPFNMRGCRMILYRK